MRTANSPQLPPLHIDNIETVENADVTGFVNGLDDGVGTLNINGGQVGPALL